MPKINNYIKIKKADYDLIVGAYPNSATISTGATITYDPNSIYLVDAEAGGSGGFTLLDVYPVGSIYLSVNSLNPSQLFGGTWEQIQGQFLLGAGTTPGTINTYTVGSTGGSASHTFRLTINNIPRHRHDISITTESKSVEVGGQTSNGTTDENGTHCHPVGTYETDGAGGDFLEAGLSGTHDNYDSGYGYLVSKNSDGSWQFYKGLYTNRNGNHSHSFSITTNAKSVEVGGQTFSGYTGYSGQQPPTQISVPTLPPYLVVYIWKRIA